MAKWLDRIEHRANTMMTRRPGRAEKATKAFSMPPFWSTGERVAMLNSSINPDRERSAGDFVAMMRDLYQSNGVVFTCMAARLRVFAQGRFAFQRFERGRPATMYTNDGLSLLERPWYTGTTGELLAHMEVDASSAGNFYATVVDEAGRIGPSRVKAEDKPFVSRMRPDWCELIIGAPSGNPWNVDARVIGLQYTPPGMKEDPLILTRSEFVHYSPLPDPLARFRGMSWMTPIIREAQADRAYTDHKLAFLRNGATPNLVVKVGDDVEDEDFQAFVAQFRKEYEGASNAYRTLFLAGGADVTPLSMDFAQLELRATQGQLETRIAAAAGVHPALAGLSEGLQGSSLNAGNYTAVRRLFVDSTIRYHWGIAAPALEVIAPPPDSRSRLAVDGRDIPFLRDDAAQEAATFKSQIEAAAMGTREGWDPDAMVTAAKTGDIAALSGKHSGMISVQLHTPGETPEPPDPAVAPGTGIREMPEIMAANGARVNGNGRTR
jgi:hypothetical protein